MKADEPTNLIAGYKITPAYIHEHDLIESWNDKKDRGQKVYTDRACRSEKIENELSDGKMISMIHEKECRNKPFTKRP